MDIWAEAILQVMLRGAGLVGFYSKVLEGVLFLVLGSSLLEACF
jgi:hypothetical protein